MSDTGELPTDNLLTIAEAAAQIGVTERALRRRLARPEYAAQTRQVTRRTRTGTRTAAGLSPRLIEALIAEFQKDIEAAERGSSKPAERGEDAAEHGQKAAEARGTRAEEHGAVAVEGTLPAALYQKMLADKDAEIEYLRGQLNLAQQNLAREQTLRAMPALPSGQAEEERSEEDEGEKPASSEPPRGWWARLWGHDGK